MYVIKHEVHFALAKWVFSTSYIFGISQDGLHPDIKFKFLKIKDLFMSGWSNLEHLCAWYIS